MPGATRHCVGAPPLQSGPLRAAHSLSLRGGILTNLSAQWWRGGSRRYEMVNVK